MSPGKAIAQAGHAFLDTFQDALSRDPSRAAAYALLRPGTKITLDGRDETALRRLVEKLDAAGIPHALIVDHGHIEPPDFDGTDTVTALGIGPVGRTEARRILSSFRLWRGKGGRP